MDEKAIDAMSLEDINAKLAGYDSEFQSNPLGLPNALNTAVNAVPTLSRGLAQGVDTAATSARIGFRQLGEKLGLVDPEVTQQMRDNLAQRENTMQAAADREGFSGTHKVGEFLGNTASNVVMSGLAPVGLLSELGSGAASGFISDPNASLSDRALNTAIGAGTAGAFRSAAAVRKALFGVPSEQGAKELALRSLGMTPRASQIAEEGSLAAKALGKVEQGLNTVPGVGIQSKVAQNAAQYSVGMLKVMDELDGAIPKSSDLYKATVDLPAAASVAFPTSTVQKAAQEGLDKLSYIKNLPGDVVAQLQTAKDTALMTMPALQQAREQLDDVIKYFKPNADGAKKVTDSTLGTLYNLRKSMSTQLDEMAGKFGGDIKSKWAQANQSHIQEKFSKGIRKAIMNGFDGDPLEGGTFSVNKFMDNLKKTKAKLALSNIKPAPHMEQAVKNFSIVGNMLKNDTVKVSKNAGLNALPTKLNAIVAGALATLGLNVGMVGSAIAGGVALPVIKGMSALVSTPSGLKMLAKISPNNLNNAYTRRTLASAAVVGIADIMKHPDYANAPVSGEIKQQSIDNMSLDEINAELARRGNN